MLYTALQILYDILQIGGNSELTSLQKRAVENPLPVRKTLMQDLKTEEFDVLIVGGGATGCGVALDSVSRGNLSLVL